MRNENLRMFMFAADLQSALIALGIHFVAVGKWHELSPKQALGELGIKTSDSLPDDWEYFEFSKLAKIEFDKNHRSIKAVTDLDGKVTFFIRGDNHDWFNKKYAEIN